MALTWGGRDLKTSVSFFSKMSTDGLYFSSSRSALVLARKERKEKYNNFCVQANFHGTSRVALDSIS